MSFLIGTHKRLNSAECDSEEDYVLTRDSDNSSKHSKATKRDRHNSDNSSKEYRVGDYYSDNETSKTPFNVGRVNQISSIPSYKSFGKKIGHQSMSGDNFI